MASGYSAPNIAENIKILSGMFNSLSQDIILSIVEDCNYDFNKASSVLAEMCGPNIGSKEVVMTKSQGSGNSSSGSFSRHKIGPLDSIIGFIKQGYKVLVLMRGLPGSGKTTAATNILLYGLGESVNKDEFIFSTDQYFYKTGTYVYNIHQLEEAHQWNQRRCFSNMKKGVSPIIIDNTNLKMWEMKVYCVMAVQFGYIIEIVEAMTPWALNPKELAQRNEHGVDKQKIIEMRERYQQKVTVKQLLVEFSLKYTDHMPQFRKYPPFPLIVESDLPMINSPPPTNVWRAPQREYGTPEKKKSQLPIEYVHRFEIKRETASPKKQAAKPAPDVDQMLNLNNDTRSPNISPNDLISFLNEHKSVPKKEDRKISSDNELLAKQLQENNELMSKMMAYLTQQSAMNIQKIVPVDEKVTSSVSDIKMEVDQPVKTENERFIRNETDTVDKSQSGSSTDGIDVLERENKVLWELLHKTQASKSEKKKEFSSGNLNSLSMIGMMKDEEKKSDDSSNSFEFIENITSTTAEQSVKSIVKDKKSSIPKFDSEAWGLSESALVSWDATSPPYEIPSVLDTKPISIQTNNQSTNTTEEDFKLMLSGSGSSSSVTKLTSREMQWMPMSISMQSNRIAPPKKVTLDKGCMTDEEELLLALNCAESEQVKKLKELFPDVQLEDLMDVYDKCDKDFHWAVDLLSNSPTHLPSTSAAENMKNKNGSRNSDQTQMNKSLNFVLNDWNMVPSPQTENTQEADEEITKKKQEEEEAKQLKKQEEVLKLKKQVEEAVTIGKEHYSEHVWHLKNVKTGAVPRQQTPAEVPVKSELPELMNVDDDTIYVSSDENSDSDSEKYEMSEDFVELNLGKDVVQQLESMFGQLMPEENFKPVVLMPESLARQLHALYLESICRQLENQSEYISSQMKDDEQFAMKLQEEERGSSSGSTLNEIMDEALAMSIYQKDIDQWKNVTPDTLALKLTRQKLHGAFPQIEPKLLNEVLVAHDNNYMDTINAIVGSMGTPPYPTALNVNPMEPPISDTTLNEMRKQDQFVNKVTDDTDGAVKSAAAHRDDANRHMQKRRELLQLAQEQYQKRSYEVAMYYRYLAQTELKKAEVSNQHATQCFIEENAQKLQQGDTLDLHFLYVKDAIVTLDIFLDYQISNLKSNNKPYDYYFVITGRGRRSENGISRLKPAVIRRLKARQVHYGWMNPGMLRIKVQKNLPMSNDLEKLQTKNK